MYFNKNVCQATHPTQGFLVSQHHNKSPKLLTCFAVKTKLSHDTSTSSAANHVRVCVGRSINYNTVLF